MLIYIFRNCHCHSRGLQNIFFQELSDIATQIFFRELSVQDFFQESKVFYTYFSKTIRAGIEDLTFISRTICINVPKYLQEILKYYIFLKHFPRSFDLWGSKFSLNIFPRAIIGLKDYRGLARGFSYPQSQGYISFFTVKTK